jgi:hypothetical protein
MASCMFPAGRWSAARLVSPLRSRAAACCLPADQRIWAGSQGHRGVETAMPTPRQGCWSLGRAAAAGSAQQPAGPRRPRVSRLACCRLHALHRSCSQRARCRDVTHGRHPSDSGGDGRCTKCQAKTRPQSADTLANGALNRGTRRVDEVFAALRGVVFRTPQHPENRNPQARTLARAATCPLPMADDIRIVKDEQIGARSAPLCVWPHDRVPSCRQGLGSYYHWRGSGGTLTPPNDPALLDAADRLSYAVMAVDMH